LAIVGPVVGAFVPIVSGLVLQFLSVELVDMHHVYHLDLLTNNGVIGEANYYC
jgi:hypothetical protein